MNCTALADWIRGMLKNRDLAFFEDWLQVLEDDSRWHDLASFREYIPSQWLVNLLPNCVGKIDKLLRDLDARRRSVRSILKGK
jgi:hypothetical protein